MGATRPRQEDVIDLTADTPEKRRKVAEDDSDDEEEPDSGSDSDSGEWHHPGEMEPDYEGDSWADHDEDCHGTINSNALRREYPDG